MAHVTDDDKQILQTGVNNVFDGERTEARARFRELLIANPKNYKAWLWLAYTAATEEEKRAALYQALLLQPKNEKVQHEFRKMHSTQYVHRAAQRGTFVCYTRADDIFAIELAEKIKERQLPVWIDMLDIRMDEDWHDAINAAMERSGLMLLILSPEMIASEDTRAELEYFLLQGKIVLPIMFRDCDPSPLRLMHPIVNFRQNYKTGLRVIYALLGITRGNTIG